MTTRTETLSALLDTLVDDDAAAPITYDVVDDDVIVSRRSDIRDRAEACAQNSRRSGSDPGSASQ